MHPSVDAIFDIHTPLLTSEHDCMTEFTASGTTETSPMTGASHASLMYVIHNTSCNQKNTSVSVSSAALVYYGNLRHICT